MEHVSGAFRMTLSITRMNRSPFVCSPSPNPSLLRRTISPSATFTIAIRSMITTYTLNQFDALCRYTDDGVLSIDNNLAERQMKLPAIGRKNWLFVGSEAGGDRAAILLSIIASAKLCEVEPWAWLNAVLRELPIRLATAEPDKPPDVTDLMPDARLKAHPEHRWKIDDLRKKEREQSRQ